MTSQDRATDLLRQWAAFKTGQPVDTLSDNDVSRIVEKHSPTSRAIEADIAHQRRENDRLSRRIAKDFRQIKAILSP